jgi:toluene monooxygenase system protein A
VPGILAWMGITPDVAGDDGHQYAWAAEYLPAQPAAAAGA